MESCPVRVKLEEDVQSVLTDLIHLVDHEREAVKIEAPATIDAIDQLIEKTFGRKERTIGALYQHRSEHGC